MRCTASRGTSTTSSTTHAGRLTAQERADWLAGWSADFLADLDWGATSDPVSRAVIDTIERWAIPAGYFADFFEAMRMDLTVTSYPTYDDLAKYMWGSAGVIGLQMLPILGRRDDTVRWDVLEPHAVALGTAFQLTNFIRDVADDLRRGRVYLPQESLDEFGVDRDRLARGRVDEPIRNLLAWEIERARGPVCAGPPGHRTRAPDVARLPAHRVHSLRARSSTRSNGPTTTCSAAGCSVGPARRARVGLAGFRGAWTARRGGPPTPTGRA